MAALQEGVISIDIGRFAHAQKEFHFKRIANRCSNLALHGEYIVEFTVVRLRPQVRVGACLDKLRRNAYSVAYLAHRSFQYMSDV